MGVVSVGPTKSAQYTALDRVASIDKWLSYRSSISPISIIPFACSVKPSELSLYDNLPNVTTFLSPYHVNVNVLEVYSLKSP